MKKIALMLALVVIGYAAGAQSLNVSSAREAQNRGYLDKAKKLIDPACEHEQTRNDAKTWYYAGLIYSQIGGEADKAKSKYKNLDPDWLIKCKNAAMRCKELDTDNEYADGNNTILSFVGNEYYKKAIVAFNQQDWDNAMSLAEESVKIFNEPWFAPAPKTSWFTRRSSTSTKPPATPTKPSRWPRTTAKLVPTTIMPTCSWPKPT